MSKKDLEKGLISLFQIPHIKYVFMKRIDKKFFVWMAKQSRGDEKVFVMIEQRQKKPNCF